MRSTSHRLLATLAAVCALLTLTAAQTGDCLPTPDELVCELDEDCPSDEMCNVLGECVPAYVTIVTDSASTVQGVPLEFTVQPRRLDIEVIEGGGGCPWHVDWWDPVSAQYVRLRTEMPYGCRAIGCADGEPVLMCVDPEPAVCVEYDEPFDVVWTGYHWVSREITCGGDTVRVWEHRLAPTGSYRLTFRYGRDDRPGYTPPADMCTVQDSEAMTPFSLTAP